MTRHITRREALGQVAGLAAAVAVGGCGRSSSQASGAQASSTREEEAMKATDAGKRMPLVFLPHGGGPWPFLKRDIFGAPGMWDQMAAYMKGLSMTPPERPRAVLVVSAHWEAPQPTVMTSSRPPMLYDYYGFPPEAYEVQWPAPGAPEAAAEVAELLAQAGFETASDPERGFDHGTFVPMKLTWPQADVPTFQLSLKEGLNPEEHVKMGRALAPLRDRGVFIVGSGMSYHNLRGLMGGMRSPEVARQVADDSKAFDQWLSESVTMDTATREQRLIEWARAPRARASHPREEHLLPLMVVAGAALEDAGQVPYRDQVMNAWVSAVHFG